MKNTRKLLATVLSLVMILTALPLTAVNAFAETFTSGDFKYEVISEEEKTCEIKKYNGSATELEIPSHLDGYTVTSIGTNAFKYYSLTSVTIPNSVTSIGNSAFSSCTSLTSITIPNSVTIIRCYAFENTGYYNNEENWKNGVLYIGNYLIKAKDTISGSYAIKDGTKVIADEAFRGCKNLTSVIITDSVTSIPARAFEYCTSLTGVTIPDSVTSIGQYAFFYCTSLTSVTIPNSVTSIRVATGISVFDRCDSLTEINVDSENSKYSSQDGVLFDKEKTTLIQYPIGNPRSSYAIPNSVTSIEENAFSNCASLTNIAIPNSVTNIAWFAFHNCDSLTEVVIPNSVTNICISTFEDCDSLTEVTIPNSVTSIDDSAFSNCANLTNVTIPNSVKSIGYYAFKKCTRLTTVTIGNSVRTIWNEAFSGCESLTNVSIPNSVEKICDSAFAGCNNLMDVYYSSSKEDWNKIYIKKINNNCLINATIHCIDGLINEKPIFINKQLRFENEVYLMNINDIKEIKAYICDAYYDNGKIVYENKEPIDSSNLNWSTNVGEENKVISFDGNGKVTALSEGLAYLSANVKDKICMEAVKFM